MEIDTNDIFPWRDEEGSEEESSKSPAMALQPDLREALETDLASFSLYAAMNYTSGVEECESRLMRTLRLATVALEANPSPRSLSLLLTSCRALYALAHRYNRPGIKILCADAMMGTEARWRWTMRACGESNTAAEEQESKQAGETREVLESALARCREDANKWKLQAEALSHRLQQERRMHTQSQSTVRAALELTRRECERLQEEVDRMREERRQAEEEHDVSEREATLCSLLSANCEWYVREEKRLRSIIRKLRGRLAHQSPAPPPSPTC